MLYNQKQIIELLLKNDAEIEALSNNYTTLMFAAYQGHSEIVKLLLQYGANAAFKNSSNQTALSLAKLQKVAGKTDQYNAIIEMLKQAGAV